MSPIIVTETRESLLNRRAAVLARLGMTAEEFAHLAATKTLTGAEWEARDELDEIAFLLGE